MAVACVDSESGAAAGDDTPATFGGSSGSGGSGGGVDSGVGGDTGVAPWFCDGRAPGEAAVIDDFEDANLNIVSAPGRTGYWSSNLGESTPMAMLVDGGVGGSDFALHHTVEVADLGESAVTVALGTDVSGSNCPYNASAFAGIGFFIRGTGWIEVRFLTADVFTTEFGGLCDEQAVQCWDAHRKAIVLEQEWEYRQIAWDELSQAGWGEPVSFNPANLRGLEFVGIVGGGPVELWLDDVSFVTEAELGTIPDGTHGDPSGAAGAAGSSGS